MKAIRQNRKLIVSKIPSYKPSKRGKVVDAPKKMEINVSYSPDDSVGAVFLAIALDQTILPLIEKALNASRASKADIAEARGLYQNDSVKIDSDAVVSKGADGRWVSAWVFIQE